MSDIKEKEVKEESYDVVYRSKLLNKEFTDLEELKKAEADYNAVHEVEIKKAEERKAAAKEIEEAYKHAMAVRKEAKEAIRKADEEYYKLRDEFVNKYGSYHVSYSNKDGNEIVTVSDLFDSFFNRFWF